MRQSYSIYPVHCTVTQKVFAYFYGRANTRTPKFFLTSAPYLLTVTLEYGDDLFEILVEHGGVLVRPAGQDLGRVLREDINRQDSYKVAKL